MISFHFRSTREVHLQDNRIDDNALENLSSVNLAKIEVFDISHNQISTIEALIPISKRWPHLQLLNLSYNKISNLETNNLRVTLDISNNNISCNSIAPIKQRIFKVKISLFLKLYYLKYFCSVVSVVSVSVSMTTTSVSTAQVDHWLTFQT